MTPQAIARAILELYGDDPKRWTQRAYGRDEDGDMVCVDELDRAVCFCVRGATFRVTPSYEVARPFYRALMEAIGHPGDESRVVPWNDDPARTFDDVRRMLTQIAEAP